MLTATQKRTFDFIVDYQTEHGGVSPSFTEMMAAFGVSSRSNIFHRLEQLEARGYIRRLPNRRRAIQVLHKTPPRVQVQLRLVHPAPASVPVVNYPNAEYFTVGYDKYGDAKLVPLKKKAS